MLRGLPHCGTKAPQGWHQSESVGAIRVVRQLTHGALHHT